MSTIRTEIFEATHSPTQAHVQPEGWCRRRPRG